MLYEFLLALYLINFPFLLFFSFFSYSFASFPIFHRTMDFLVAVLFRSPHVWLCQICRSRCWAGRTDGSFRQRGAQILFGIEILPPLCQFQILYLLFNRCKLLVCLFEMYSGFQLLTLVQLLSCAIFGLIHCSLATLSDLESISFSNYWSLFEFQIVTMKLY